MPAFLRPVLQRPAAANEVIASMTVRNALFEYKRPLSDKTRKNQAAPTCMSLSLVVWVDLSDKTKKITWVYF